MQDNRFPKKQINQQLPLGLMLQDDASLANYYPGSNDLAFQHVKQVASGKGEFFLYLWGSIGVGCTHLLQGACHFAVESGLSAMYLPLSNHSTFSVSTLQGLEQLDLVCLDDVQAIAGNKEWEEALFHLFNRMREREHTHLMVSSQMSPSGLNINLPDLKSRLSWGVVYHILPLNDEQKLHALKLRAKQRGLELPTEVGEYLIRRSVRSMQKLYETLEVLDKASLAAQRKLTVPFVKTVLLL